MSTVRMLSPFLLLLLVHCHSLRATGVAKQLPAQLAVHKKMSIPDPDSVVDAVRAADRAKSDAAAVVNNDKFKGETELADKFNEAAEKFNEAADVLDRYNDFRDTFSPPPPLLPLAPAAAVDLTEAEAEAAVDNYKVAVDNFKVAVDTFKDAKNGSEVKNGAAAVPVQISSFHVSSFLASFIFLGLFSF